MIRCTVITTYDRTTYAKKSRINGTWMTTLDIQLRDRYSTRVHKLIKRCIVYAGTPGFENACIYVCSNHLVVNQFALPPVIKGLLVLVQAVLPHSFAMIHFLPFSFLLLLLPLLLLLLLLFQFLPLE